MIFFLLAAVWTCLRSLDSKRWVWWLIASGVLIGIAFNTKMLAAFIPGPAFVLAIAVGSRCRWRERIGRLAVFGLAVVVVSASWLVDRRPIPASARPYVGGSTDNTVWDLDRRVQRPRSGRRPRSAAGGGGAWGAARWCEAFGGLAGCSAARPGGVACSTTPSAPRSPGCSRSPCSRRAGGAVEPGVATRGGWRRGAAGRGLVRASTPWCSAWPRARSTATTRASWPRPSAP